MRFRPRPFRHERPPPRPPTARVVVLPSEDMAAYTAFSAEIVDSLDARTPIERQFAQTVADNQWRINRIRSIEDALGHACGAGDLVAGDSESKLRRRRLHQRLRHRESRTPVGPRRRPRLPRPLPIPRQPQYL